MYVWVWKWVPISSATTIDTGDWVKTLVYVDPPVYR